MKIVFQWLLAGSFALLCAIAPARAQNTTLDSGFASLAQATDAVIALSNEGGLSRSTDHGSTFINPRPAENPRALYALAASDTTVVAMGDASYFVRSTDSGLNYSSLTHAVGPTGGSFRGLAAHFVGPSTTWVAVGDTGTNMAILRSIDDGASWSVAASVPAIEGALNGVAWTGSRWVAVGTDGFGDGVILASLDGNTWSKFNTSLSFIGLNAIASNGSGKVVIVGDAGTVLYATDGGAAGASFTNVGESVVSEDLQAVAFLSGDNWIIGGDSGVLVSFKSAENVNETETGVVADADPATGGAPVTALLWTGSGANYYVSTPSENTPSEPHGPISLQIAIVSGQLQLTLVGAEDGNSYHIESSATLASFSPVASSTQAYSGGPAPTWTFPAPAAGARIFYRAKVGAEP